MRCGSFLRAARFEVEEVDDPLDLSAVVDGTAFWYFVQMTVT